MHYEWVCYDEGQQSAPAIDCARVRDSPDAPYAGGQTGSPGGAGREFSGARGGAPGFASAGRSPQRYTGGDDTAKEPQMKQTPAPMRPSLACYHGGRVVFVAFAFEPLATMPPPLVAARVPRAVIDAPKVPARRGRPPGSTKKKKEAALAAQAALAAAGGLRAPGRVNPELEPTDDEIEAELNTMLGAPAAAAAALADVTVKQEA